MRSDETVISVQNLAKKYRLYSRPQDRLKQQFFQRFGKQYGRDFWALRNVSFEVKRGEFLGIVGRNGSGKSTLLQLLAGVLKPTQGDVFVQGRVAALLELGSGFNPEYTGRENVFMNGAILGIPRTEMAARFKDIAAFADIGAFLDQPVKTYSSGMFVRLAFAVTTHVEADVLLIDEALAVGDVFFRQKCYQRLELLRERDVTIILVSHAVGDVEQFCQRALLLHNGAILFEGPAPEAIKRYYLVQQGGKLAVPPVRPPADPPQAVAEDASAAFWPPAAAFLDLTSVPQVSNGWAYCTGVAVCNSQGEPCRVFQQGETASFFYEFELQQSIEVPIAGLVLSNDKGIIVHGKSTLEYGSDVPLEVTQGARLRFRQDITLEIALGEYTVEVGLAFMRREDYDCRALYAHRDLNTKILRLCHLPAAGQFAVVFRRQAMPVYLLHHGVANLPGHCQVRVLPPDERSKRLDAPAE